MTKPQLTVVSNTAPPSDGARAEPPPEQVEMPFAVVNGEPVTELPRDLYIPPQALEVFLEAFEGPLDISFGGRTSTSSTSRSPRSLAST
jgi:segregation and condensation protein A